MLRTVITFVTLSGCATIPDDPGTDLPPVQDACIVAELDAPSFEPVLVYPPGQSAALGLTVRNGTDQERCGGDLQILGLTGLQAPFSVGPAPSNPVAPGDSVTVELRFSPTARGEYAASLELRSNDPEQPVLSFALAATGAGPVLDVQPAAADVGDPYIGCTVERTIGVTNLGNAPLTAARVELFTAAPDEFAVALPPEPPLPVELAPFDVQEDSPRYSFQATYRPLDTFADTAFITVSAVRPMSSANATISGRGRFFDDQEDRFTSPGDAPADIVVAVDRSESMEGELASVEQNLQDLAEEVAADPRDLRLTVIVADDGCPIGEVPFIDNAMTAAEARDVASTMLDADGTASPPGSLTSEPFDLIAAALSTTNLALDGCNSPWYRDAAQLSALGITDSALGDGKAWSTDLAKLTAVKADPALLTVHAAAGDVPGGCVGAEAGDGLYEMTIATGGTFASICKSDFASDLWAGTVAGKEPAVWAVLSRPPVPERIEVRVDGLRRDGWTYDASSNGIVFDWGAVPAVGAEVEVDYAVQGPCE